MRDHEMYLVIIGITFAITLFFAWNLYLYCELKELRKKLSAMATQHEKHKVL